MSLEATFLSTFIMISENRADAKRQVLADGQWEMIQAEEPQNQQLWGLSTRLMTLTTHIHALTTEVHQLGKRLPREGATVLHVTLPFYRTLRSADLTISREDGF